LGLLPWSGLSAPGWAVFPLSPVFALGFVHLCASDFHPWLKFFLLRDLRGFAVDLWLDPRFSSGNGHDAAN
jgi:hypothetical protein